MKLRILMLPIALLAVLAIGYAEPAEAAPLTGGASAHGGLVFGGRIFVGGRVGIPIGHSGGYHREHVTYTGGYYVTRTREVQVPGAQIGWDFEGKPIYAGSSTRLETYREWVPRRRIVHRTYVPRRARGFVTVGGRWRIR